MRLETLESRRLLAADLSPGDLVITGVNTDSPDDFAFVPLVDLDANVEIKFTDNGILADGSLRGGEGTAIWTAPAGGVTAGTKIIIDGTLVTTGPGSVSSNSLGLSASGDQVIAYQDSATVPGEIDYIFALQTNSNQFQSGSSDSNQSDLPASTGLVEGTSAVAVGVGAGAESETDNAQFDNSIVLGDPATLQAAVANAANWTQSNSALTLSTVDFTVLGGVSGAFVAVSTDMSDQTEGDAGVTPFTFTVTRSGDLSAASTVDFAVSSTEADAADFGGILPSGSVSFAIDETEQTITIDVSGDTDTELDEAFLVTLSNPSVDTTITASTATGIIRNDDIVGLVPPQSNDFESGSGPAGLGDGWTTFSVDADTGDTWGSATQGGDGVAEANAFGASVAADDWLISPAFDLDQTAGEIVTFETFTQFADGGIVGPEVTFLYSTDYSGLGDPSAAIWTPLTYTAAAEDSQVFTPSGNIDISGISGALVYFAFQYQSTGTGGGDTSRWLVDDFSVQVPTAAPDFAIAETDAVKAEGDSATTAFTFTVTRSVNTIGAASVDYTVGNVDTDASDFSGALSGTVNFADGETTQVITVDVVGDEVEESDEDFTVTLSNPSNSGTLSTSVATGTIIDDDAPLPVVFLNEFHYDNISGDVGEFVEVAGEAGANLLNWSVVHYNGSNGEITETIALSGTIPDEGGTGFGALSFTPSGSFQNSVEGFALVDPAGTVVEFFSYEGNVTATEGPASGLTSTDVGVVESNGSTQVGFSLQRDNSILGTPGDWYGPEPDSPGLINPVPIADVIVDTEDSAGVSLTGSWARSSNAAGFQGDSYLYAKPGQESSATLTPTLPADGVYEVFISFAPSSNRATDASVSVHHADGTFSTELNQTFLFGSFVSLGEFNFAAGTSGEVVIDSTGADGFVIADAVLFDFLNAPSAVVPSADLVAPAAGSELSASDLNAAGFIDVEFLSLDGIDTSTIEDAAAEFSLSGAGAGDVVIDGAGVLQSGTTYRYAVTSGSFAVGEVMVDFTAGSFSSLAPLANTAEQESFTLTDGTISVDLDDTDAVRVGKWNRSSTVAGAVNDSYLYAGGGTAKELLYTPDLPLEGAYEVFATYTSDVRTRASNAGYTIVSQDGVTDVALDQRTGGGVPTSLGTFNFSAGTLGSVTISALDADGVVIGDAIQFVRVGDSTSSLAGVVVDNTDATQLNTWFSSDAVPGYLGDDYFRSTGSAAGLIYTPTLTSDGLYEVLVNYTDGTNRASNATYEVASQNGTSVVEVDQRTGGGTFQSIGTFNFLAGSSGTVTLKALGADGVVIGDAVQFVRLGDLSGTPTASLADPLEGGSILDTTINGRDFIDVTFTSTTGFAIDASTITDAGAEFTLTGPGAVGVTVVGAATLVSGDTYRYTTVGDFSPGSVDAVFSSGSFADLGANENIDTIASFIVAEDVLEEVIVDNSDAGFSVVDPDGNFFSSNTVNGFIGPDYLAAATGSTATATWTPTLSQTGQYEVYVRFPAHPLRATNASYVVTHDGGTTNVSVDQTTGGDWVLLGTFTMTDGLASVQLQTAGANQFVIADAARFVLI